MSGSDNTLISVLISSLELSRLFLSGECSSLDEALVSMDVSDDEADILLELVEQYLSDKSQLF